MTQRLLAKGKQIVPAPLKEATRSGLRRFGRVTSAARPLPDFLILGTKRGGTTSLWNYLVTHPLVLPMFPAAENLKSPHYFYWHYDRGPSWYRSHFASTPTRELVRRREGGPTATGEASPYYLYDPRVAERAARLVPGARLVVLLRDPVERAYSHYKERVRAGVEPLSFEAALTAEATRLEGEIDRMRREPAYYSRAHDWYSYRDRGVYLPQLRRWLEHYPREQLLVLRSEDFYDAPGPALERVVHFIGLPVRPMEHGKRWNYEPAKGMDPGCRAELGDFYAPRNAELADFLGMELGWDGGRS